MAQQIGAIPFFQLKTHGAFRARDPHAKGVAVVLSGKYHEFYCQAGGSNLNSGSDQNNTAKYTATNGNWSTTTLQYIPTDGTNPADSGVKPGDWASVYVDGSATAVCSLLIVQVVNDINGPITMVSAGGAGVNCVGTAPVTSATARTIKVGGAWRGPNGSTNFPFGFGFAQANNLAGNPPRVNMRNDVTYVFSGVVNFTGGTGFVVQGYQFAVGDGGKAILDGNGINMGGGGLITLNGSITVADLIGQNVSNADGANHIFRGGNFATFFRCVARQSPSAGFAAVGSPALLLECEAYNCCRVINSDKAAFNLTSASMCINCYSHDNNGNVAGDGFGMVVGAGGVYLINCISESNSRYGFKNDTAANGHIVALNCDFYNNGSDGIRGSVTTLAGTYLIQNCNFFKNGGYGINIPQSSILHKGFVSNCAFGQGTQKNGLGPGISRGTNSVLDVSGSIDFPPDTTPWVAPATGNFTKLSNIITQSRGRSNFTQVDGVNLGTTSFPDIGATNALDGIIVWQNGSFIFPVGYIGREYGLSVAAYSSELVFSIVSGSLPPGLAFAQISPTTFIIDGIPTLVGTYDFVLRVAVGYRFEDASMRITILDSEVWGDFDFADGYIGLDYKTEWYLENLDHPVVYLLTSGELPPGLELDNVGLTAEGRISGVPTTEGSYTFVLQASGPSGTLEQKEFTIAIHPSGQSSGYIYGN